MMVEGERSKTLIWLMGEPCKTQNVGYGSAKINYTALVVTGILRYLWNAVEFCFKLRRGV